MSIIINRAKKEDVAAIFELGQKIPELKYSKDSPFCEILEVDEWVADQKINIILTAKLGNKLVGFLIAKMLSKSWCALDDIAVAKKFRGQGIGNKLLNKLYDILKKKKINYINVLIGASYKRVRAFWRAKGFKETKKFVWAEKDLAI